LLLLRAVRRFLAEDRILCFEIVARRHRRWLLKYIPGSVADTDVPETLLELLKQRRRWLNGSFMSTLYTLQHSPRLLEAGHGPLRKATLVAQM
jgi:chitin synthase